MTIIAIIVLVAFGVYFGVRAAAGLILVLAALAVLLVAGLTVHEWIKKPTVIEVNPQDLDKPSGWVDVPPLPPGAQPKPDDWVSVPPAPKHDFDEFMKSRNKPVDRN